MLPRTLAGAALASLALLGLALGPAAAHHEPLACWTEAIGFTTATNPVACGMPVRCPAGGAVCAYTLEVEAAGIGVVSGVGTVDGAEVAACGPLALSCLGSGDFTLAPGATAFVECHSGLLTASFRVSIGCYPEALH